MIVFNKYLVLFFEGISVFMTLYFLIQFIILQKKEYLFYSIYLLCLSLYYLVALPDFFFDVAPNDARAYYWYDMFKRPLQFCSSIFYSLFIMFFLRLHKTAPKLNRFLIGLLYFYLANAIMCLLGNIFRVDYDQAYFVLSFLFFPVQVAIVLLLFRYKVPYGYYVIWGSTLVVFGSLFTLLLDVYLKSHSTRFYNQMDYSYIPVQITILADIFLFSIALQHKVADNEKRLGQLALQQQLAIHHERERIITDLHDDIGGGLSSIRIMSDLLTNHEKNNPESKASLFAQKISVTIKEIAQRMNTIIWSLNVENDLLQNFSEYVRQYGVQYFEDSPIKFECEICDLPKEGIVLTGIQRKNLFLIAKEAFHNILKHSNASRAFVKICVENAMLKLQIIDNGVGFVEENQFGNGLKNMQKRMNEIHGNLHIHSNQGIQVEVTLPLSKVH